MKKRGLFFGALLIGSITQTMVDLIVLTKWDIIEIYFMSVMVGILITVGVGVLHGRYEAACGEALRYRIRERRRGL